MNVLDYSKRITDEIQEILAAMNPEQAEKMATEILSAKRVFLAGAGRSLLMLKAFAMRLMHAGFTAYVAGETVTPAITEEDMLVVGTGSGETATLRVVVEKAKKVGAKIGVLSTKKNSSIAQMADYALIIPASINHLEIGKSWQPGGNSFEQSLLIILDAMLIKLAEAKGVDISKGLNLHANLE
ncbi:MAG TPA: 6-phospho-3-hexuloisomerase [Firmicutes bacterium]|jgi:6-phospho-3-hexuloisomerase|nr:6-phospho-3-hexuloisomerase [Bacillota bacterium]